MSEEVSQGLSLESEDVLSKSDDPCPAVLEIGPLSPIHCVEVEVETCPDEGYITRSFTQDLPITPIMSTPLRPPKQTPDLVAGAEAALAVPYCLDESSISKPDGLWESTLLEVQVKSKVVLPEPVQPPEPEQSVKGPSPGSSSGLPASPRVIITTHRVTPPSNKRPRVFERLGECPQEKAICVESGAEVARTISYSLDDYSVSRPDSLWESTLIEVQVNSEVVVPERPAEPRQSVKAPSSGLPAASRVFRAGRRVTPPSNKRPRVFERPEEWQREKAIYVESVSRHMKENQGGVFNELLELMNTVASEQRPWKHPSDLTTRNYQPGNQGKALYSLEEWVDKNGGSYRRFSPY